MDRQEAGLRLARLLEPYAHHPAVVLALPRGGVPVGAIVADHLRAPLDVLLVRKIGAPDNPEYGLGAVAEGGITLLDEGRIRACGLAREDLELEIQRKQRQLQDLELRYRAGRSPVPVEGRIAILVDDGLATGVTARAAVLAVRSRRPTWVVLAVGVASPSARDAVRRVVDELFCPIIPDEFYAVGEWYREFPQVSDSEVVRLLNGRDGRS